jgi:flagellar biosynthesis/type III secretory pathway M-ring protein FliF/YscJ
MSTGAIVAIVVLVAIFVILLAALPRIRARRQERELQHQRDRAAETHRTEAELKSARADHAERLAQKERAEADLHESRARLHEQGLADDELDRDLAEPADQRRFDRGTTATDARDVDGDGHVADDVATGRSREAHRAP